MSPTHSIKNAAFTAPTAEMRNAISALGREMEIMRRREEIREAELRRLTDELEQAGRLQRQFTAAPLPAIRGAELTAFAHPAEGISGDFYHARRIDDDRVALVVADSTGHGIAAGLLSATVIGSVNSLGAGPESELDDPTKALSRLNRDVLNLRLNDCEFVTAIHAVFNESTRTLRWSRAGAPPPVLLRRGTKPRRLASAGLPLGVEADAEYSCAEIQLHAGDSVLLHTDGLESLHAQCTGSRAEQDFLAWLESMHANDLQAQLRSAVDRQARITALESAVDDMTVLVLRVAD